MAHLISHLQLKLPKVLNNAETMPVAPLHCGAHTWRAGPDAPVLAIIIGNWPHNVPGASQLSVCAGPGGIASSVQLSAWKLVSLAILGSLPWLVMSMVVTVIAVFLSDVRLAFTPHSADSFFTVLASICFIQFFVELVHPHPIPPQPTPTPIPARAPLPGALISATAPSYLLVRRRLPVFKLLSFDSKLSATF